MILTNCQIRSKQRFTPNIILFSSPSYLPLETNLVVITSSFLTNNYHPKHTKKEKRMRLLSTKATCNSHGQDSSYFLGWQEYEKNPYDEVHNPKGIIQMGLAENQVIN